MEVLENLDSFLKSDIIAHKLPGKMTPSLLQTC